ALFMVAMSLYLFRAFPSGCHRIRSIVWWWLVSLAGAISSSLSVFVMELFACVHSCLHGITARQLVRQHVAFGLAGASPIADYIRYYCERWLFGSVGISAFAFLAPSLAQRSP